MNEQMALFGAQRWRAHRSFYRPAGEPIDPSRYAVDLVSERDAKAFVTAHHYSGSYPAAVFRAGLYHKPACSREELVGVAVFSVPCTPAVVSCHLGLDPSAGIELGRFVLLDEVPANGESFFLARAMKLLRRHKSYRGVVAYCDPVPRTTLEGELVKPGHLGTIYKSTNARFAGRGSARTLWLDRFGRVVSERSLSKIRTGDCGVDYALRQLSEAGAPPMLPLESGSDYLERVRRSGTLRQQRHPGNLVFTWPLAA